MRKEALRIVALTCEAPDVYPLIMANKKIYQYFDDKFWSEYGSLWFGKSSNKTEVYCYYFLERKQHISNISKIFKHFKLDQLANFPCKLFIDKNSTDNFEEVLFAKVLIQNEKQWSLTDLRLLKKYAVETWSKIVFDFMFDELFFEYNQFLDREISEYKLSIVIKFYHKYLRYVQDLYHKMYSKLHNAIGISDGLTPPLILYLINMINLQIIEEILPELKDLEDKQDILNKFREYMIKLM